jgi:hypothetical protein
MRSDYRPWPVQQASAAQIGVAPAKGVNCCPLAATGSQQQQPSVSIQPLPSLSAVMVQAPPPSVPASAVPPLLLDELLEPLLLDELLEPLLLDELLEPLLLDELLPLLEPLLLDELLEPLEEPPSSPVLPVSLLLLHAGRPTVDAAPMTTTTWKSFSRFIWMPIPRVA